METVVGTSHRRDGKSKFLPWAKYSRTQGWTLQLVSSRLIFRLCFSCLRALRLRLFSLIIHYSCLVYVLAIARVLHNDGRPSFVWFSRRKTTRYHVIPSMFVQFIATVPRAAYYFYCIYATLSRTPASTLIVIIIYALCILLVG